MPFDSEWVIWEKVAQETNIHLEGVIAKSNASEEEAFNLMLSSGELADVIGYSSSADLEKLGRDGGLLALNDLIKEHAPNIQKMLDTDPKFKQGATSLDGNIYFIPKNQSLMSAEFFWIRQDWLDKLDLEVPTTVDELYTVLRFFLETMTLMVMAKKTKYHFLIELVGRCQMNTFTCLIQVQNSIQEMVK